MAESWQAYPVALPLVVIVFVLTWAGTALTLDSRLRPRHRPELAERLRPYQPGIADEAERWLRHHS
jgi:hypothetical protein